MIRRIEVEWPDDGPFAARQGRPIRFLAASDAVDRALEYEVNRAALGPIDGLLGCGDLEPAWLDYLGHSFAAPLVYVRGNHDHGGAWEDGSIVVPESLRSGSRRRVAGISITGLEWPGAGRPGNRRDEWLAWGQAVSVALHDLTARLGAPREPVLVISHVPPRGVGDVPTDAYHVGFRGYRWLLDRLRPPLWLHGHTTTASVPRLVEHRGPTTLVNVTGAVLVEICPSTGPMASRSAASDASGRTSPGAPPVPSIGERHGSKGDGR